MAGAQRAVMIDAGTGDVRIRQPAQPRQSVVGTHRPVTNLRQQSGDLFSVHRLPFYPPRRLISLKNECSVAMQALAMMEFRPSCSSCVAVLQWV